LEGGGGETLRLPFSLSRASKRRYGQGKKEKQRATAAYFSLPSSINEKETATSL